MREREAKKQKLNRDEKEVRGPTGEEARDPRSAQGRRRASSQPRFCGTHGFFRAGVGERRKKTNDSAVSARPQRLLILLLN